MESVMDEVIYLKKGGTYFYVSFMDEELKVPDIKTYIFQGVAEDCYHFIDVTSGSDNIFFEINQVFNIYDCAALSRWLLEEHTSSKPKSLEFRYELAQ
jgi:hypothetical protein